MQNNTNPIIDEKEGAASEEESAQCSVLSAQSPEPPAKLPVVVSLVMMHGGGGQVIQLPGRKKKYAFYRRNGVGRNGAQGHVREYTDLAAFHAEEEDLRSTRAGLFLVTRIGEVTAYESARAGIARVIADPVGSPAQRVERLRSLAKMIRDQLEVLVPATGMESDGSDASDLPDVPETVSETKAEPGPVDPSKRKAREMELRRMGEDAVRELVKVTYQIGGVPILNNLEGMTAAVLEWEEGLGDFDRAATVEAPAPAPVPVAAVVPAGVPGGALAVELIDGAPVIYRTGPAVVAVAAPPTAPSKRYTEAELSALPYDDIRAIGKRLGLNQASRKQLVAGILEKQGGK